MAKKNETLISLDFVDHPSGSGDPMVLIDVKDHEPAYFGRTDFENAGAFIATHIRRLHLERLQVEEAQAAVDAAREREAAAGEDTSEEDQE